MKIPQLFKSENSSEKDIERLLKTKKFNPTTVNYLLESCEEFSLVQTGKTFDDKYKMGQHFADGVSYTKHDLEELSKQLIENADKFLGFYLSALVNKIITDRDVITLTSDPLSGLLTHLERGKVIVIGDIRHCTALYMSGGIGVVKGSVKNLAAEFMQGGLLTIEGSASESTCFGMQNGIVRIKKGVGKDTGRDMYGGILRVGGEIESIADTCEGTIYQKKDKVWPIK